MYVCRPCMYKCSQWLIGLWAWELDRQSSISFAATEAKQKQAFKSGSMCEGSIAERDAAAVLGTSPCKREWGEETQAWPHYDQDMCVYYTGPRIAAQPMDGQLQQ